MKQINITLKWDKEKALNASKIFYDYDMRNSAKRYVGWFFVALTQFAIVGALKHDSYGLLFISTFLVGYWYYGRWYLRKAMLQKYYAKIPQQTLHFTLQEDGLHSEDNTLIAWDNIFKAIKIEEGIIFHTTDTTLLFTRDAFASYEDMQHFLEIMKEKGKF